MSKIKQIEKQNSGSHISFERGKQKNGIYERDFTKANKFYYFAVNGFFFLWPPTIICDSSYRTAQHIAFTLEPLEHRE